jgi:PAS domain S-box-containing protein
MAYEQGLDSSDERLQLLRAQLVGKLGSWEVDLRENVLRWSDLAFSIFEIDRSDFAGTEEAFFELIHPDDRGEFLKAREAWLEAGGSFLFEHRIITPAGKVKWVIERAQILTDDNGEPRFTTGTVQDVTDLKQAELARDAAEREVSRQMKMVKLASKIGRIGGWRYDVLSDKLEWSEETARIHEEPGDFSPTIDTAISYYVPEHRETIRVQFEKCVAEGVPFDASLQIETAKGRRRWVHTQGEAVRDESGRIVAVDGAFQDISSLVVEQEKSATLSKRLRETLEGMSDAFYLLDDEWRFVFLNSKAEALLQKSRSELIGRSALEEFPETPKNVRAKFLAAKTENCQVRIHEYYPSLDTWFDISAEPSAGGLAVYFRDVSRDHERDVQLALLEASVARLNDIVLISKAEPFDSQSGGPKVVYVNDAFERRTGFSREEIIGDTPRILQGPKTQREELDRIRTALGNWEPVRAELINYTKAGEEFWLELDIVPLANEEGWYTHWIAVERDITDRKQAELALQASEERFRLVSKAAGSAIWDWDAATDQHWWRDGLLDIFGHDPDPAGSLQTTWRRHIHPEDLARVDAATRQIMSGEMTNMRMQYRFARADGTWAVVEGTAFAVSSESGEVLRVLGSITDISERKLLEERLHQAQKMETVGQLTGGVAHDFNNLLTVIMGNAEMLTEELSDNPELQPLARMCLGAAEGGADLTHRLLAFSRKQALEPKVIDAARLVQGMDELLRRTLPENISVEIIRSGGLWKIEVDPSQLESALLNLAINARDAMPEGGKLTIEIANAMLDEYYVSFEPDVRPGQYLVIVVSDTGTGMPPEVLDRVFEPFFTTKGIGKGSGLGLSMVFGFVKQSGGHAKIYSEVGEGTAIKLYFPRIRTRKEAAKVERPQSKIVGGTETILVAEDDGRVREYVTAQLKSLGYRVLEAADGTEAFEILKREDGIDLLFTDVVMPGEMGGRALAKAASDLRPEIKVLYTSGYTENSIVHHGRLDENVRLLNKPYRREQLAAKVREVLDERVINDRN